MEFGVRFNFDDGGMSDKLAKLGRYMEKFSKIWKDYEKTATQAVKATVNEVVKTEKELAKMSVTMAQNATTAQKSYDQIKSEIGSVALAIAGSVQNSEKFVATINKLKNAKLNGVAIDLATVEQELVEIVATAKLTDDQKEILVNNIEEVATAVVAVSDADFGKVADNAEKLTKEFFNAKKEAILLKKQIDSGQLSGSDLVAAKERAAELKDAMGDTRDEINRLSSDTKGFDKIADAAKLMAAGMQIAEGSAALLGDESEDMQKTLIRLNAIMAVSAGLHQLSTEATTKGTLANKAAAAAQGLYGTVVGTSTGALKVFRVALAATGIGLVVILIGALVANWDKVKGSVDKNSKSIFEFGKKVTTVMPPLNLLIRGVEWLYNNFSRLDNIAAGVIDGVVAGLGVIGDSIGKFFSGDFSGALDSAKSFGKKVGDATKEGIKSSELEENAIIDLTSITKSQKKKLEILQAGGKETEQLQKNLAANELRLLKIQGAEKEKIAEKEQEIAVQNAQFAKERADKAKEASDKAREALKAYKNEIISLQSELKALQRDGIDDSTIEGKISKLQASEAIEIETLQKAKARSLEDIKDKKQRAEITELYGAIEIELRKKYSRDLQAIQDEEAKKFREDNEERLKTREDQVKAEKDAYDSELAERLTTFNEITKARRDNRILEIDDLLKDNNLSLNLRKQYELEKQELIIQGLEDQRALISDGYSEDAIRLDGLIDSAKRGAELLKKEIEPSFKSLGDLFKTTLMKSFSLEGEDADQLLEGFSALKDAIFNVVNEGYKAEISAIDDVINTRKDKISELEGLIAEEYDAKQAGHANSYDALVAQKENEQRLIKEDNAKKVKIQKEQLQITTSIQAAEQVGALATAVAGIFSKSATALGPFGIPLAVAAIVSMFALYKNYKSQVASLTKAYKGGKVSDYLNRDIQGRTDKGTGRGHRVEDTNMVIGANEFIMNEDSTISNLPFLREMNSGKYDNVNLMTLLRTKSDAQHVTDFNIKRQKATSNSITLKIDKAIEKQTKELREDLKTMIDDAAKRPTVIPLPSGSVKVIYHEKGNIRTEIIRAN